MSWQMQEAKNRLSEVIKAANTSGPQVITVRGKETAVVLSEREYRALCGVREPLGVYLCRTAPGDIDPDLFERRDDTGRNELP
jgi:prevent-host-death family protein